MKKLYYGIKDGKIVSISDVESGKKCGCTCPSCGERFIARKGRINIHHFAHESQKDCEYGYETTLHLLAKDIIKNTEYFVLPQEKLNLEYYKNCDFSCKYRGLNEATKIHIDKVEIEMPFSNLKPDIVLYSGSNIFFVEIFVTHRVDEEKRNKIKEKHVNTIEIDLSKIRNGEELDFIKTILLNDSDNKYWIYNNKIENIIDKMKKECRIPTLTHGLAWHTEYCPKNMRIYKGKSYANVTDDCNGCDYCLGITNQISEREFESIICTAVEGYSHNKPNDILICPWCGGKLKLFSGRFGKFYGCSNYPNCRYTRNLY